jgi:DNA-binding transcriptional regulator YhcF (GntR family)
MSASQEQREHAIQKAQKLFRIISQAADYGHQCPSNKILAERIGYKSAARVADAISFLSTAGMITVERANNARVVTITATGKKTAGEVEKPHHSAKINSFEGAAA